MKDSIILYSSPTCPICKFLKMEMDKRHIEYTLNQDRDEQIKLGFKSLPVLSVNGQLMYAPEAREWVKSH